MKECINKKNSLKRKKKHSQIRKMQKINEFDDFHSNYSNKKKQIEFEFTNDEFSNFNFNHNDASNHVNNFLLKQKNKRLKRIKKRQRELIVNKCVTTKMRVLKMKKLTHDKIDTCAKINLINHVLIKRLKLFFFHRRQFH